MTFLPGRKKGVKLHYEDRCAAEITKNNTNGCILDAVEENTNRWSSRSIEKANVIQLGQKKHSIELAQHCIRGTPAMGSNN